MANQGFTRTKSQYERSLKRWRVSKNVRKEEWDFILGRVNQRQRPTTVKVRGVTISQSRLERQKLRHRDSTPALYERKLNPLPHCQTPPNIEISTPPPSLPDDDSQLVTLPEHEYGGEPERYDQETSVGEDTRDQKVILSGEVSILSSIYDNSSINFLLKMPKDDTANGTPSLSGLHSIGSPPILSGPLYDYIYRLFSGDSRPVLQDAVRMRSQYQVHNGQRSAEDTIYQSTDILVKAIVRYNAPSREFHQIMRRTQDGSDLDLLRRVLVATGSDRDWKTFGGTLLFDAVKDGNLLLLDILLNAGVDEIAPGEEEATEYPFNALQIAVQHRHDEVIRTLTSHGAMIFTGCPYTDFEFLSQAVTEDAMHLVRPLLADCTRSLDLQIFRKGSAALSRAVTLSNDEVVDVLLEAGFSPYAERYDGPFSDDVWPFGGPFGLATSFEEFNYFERFLKSP